MALVAQSWLMLAALFDITSMRKDVKTDGRHALIEFTDDINQDAKEETLQLIQFV